MKIWIIGAGAIGGYYGAKLARAGESVHFIARGATLRALRSRGLTVVRDEETFTVPAVQVTDDATGVGPVELPSSSRISKGPFNAMWGEGRDMPLEQVIRFALGEPSSP